MARTRRDAGFRRRNGGGRHEERLGNNPSSFWAVRTVRGRHSSYSPRNRQERKSKARTPTVSSLMVTDENCELSQIKKSIQTVNDRCEGMICGAKQCMVPKILQPTHHTCFKAKQGSVVLRGHNVMTQVPTGPGN